MVRRPDRALELSARSCGNWCGGAEILSYFLYIKSIAHSPPPWIFSLLYLLLLLKGLIELSSSLREAVVVGVVVSIAFCVSCSTDSNIEIDIPASLPTALAIFFMDSWFHIAGPMWVFTSKRLSSRSLGSEHWLNASTKSTPSYSTLYCPNITVLHMPGPKWERT